MDARVQGRFNRCLFVILSLPLSNKETSTEAFNSKKRIDALTKDLSQMKTDELKYTEQIAMSKLQLEKLTKMKVRQNLQILSLKTNLEHLNTQHNVTCNKLAKITVDLEYAIQERDKNKRDLAQKTNLLKVRLKFEM